MTRTIDEITRSCRFRRMRKFNWSRRLIRENHLHVNDLIWTFFLCEGKGKCEPISSMPGIKRFSIDIALEKTLHAAELGIPAVAPFPREPLEIKTENGSYITNSENLINRFLREIKKIAPDIGVITDAALDPYTTHGHDGILHKGVILNDESVEMVVQGALAQAKAGSDIIAPSDMMDGRIGAIRDNLDANGFQDVAILSYAAKFSSAFYGPYRNAIGTAPLLEGNKNTYYLDPANSNEALREAKEDILEGADMLIVKPGILYLDIIYRLKETLSVPILSYQVSGEYAMLQAAAANGWIDGLQSTMETLIAFKRAGCDGILTYFAFEIAQELQKVT
ncbi:MAG: porphobilinogen synthase [Candidatus Tokpelaia sp. JSC161]|jgi:porphobilinogen synthase|nr:MAG: porphobilinogen synthase [Candidatus Tokpelaia sp. JSC161]